MKQMFSTIFYCLTLSWKASKFYTILRLIGKIIPPFAGIASAMLLKYVMDILSGALQVPDRVTLLIWLVLGIAALSLITAGFNKWVSYAEGLHNDILQQRVSVSIMEKSIEADLELFDNPQYYDKLTSVRRDSYATTYILWNALDFISATITFIGAGVVLCTVNPLYGLLMTAASIPSVIASQKYTKVLYRLSLEQVNEERQKGYINEIASNKQYAQDIRLFNLGGQLKRRYNRIWEKIFNIKKKKVKGRTIWTAVLEFLPEGVLAYVTLDISLKVLSGSATVGDYSLYTGLMSQLWSATAMLFSTGLQIYENKLKIENVKSFDDIPHNIKDNGTRVLEKISCIDFCGVSFAYPGGQKEVLKNITFSIGESEKLALVGVNGSGKTTLIKLLLRFYDVTSGEIRINGVNINDYTLSSVHRCFSCYFQNTGNYGFTIRENIQLADLQRQADDTAVLEAIRQSDGGNMVDKLPQGLDTYITRMFDETGVEFSGGQNQKLALARTFYRRSSALILDEPSSNLDPEAEFRLFEALRQLCDGKTTLFTSHRLSNITLADRIVVIENGVVVENGTCDDLLKLKGRFSELYQYQADKFNGVRKE